MHHLSARTLRAATLACTILCAAPALAASTDYLLKLEGVKGESKDDKHKDQIEILSYSWGETRSPDVDGNGQSDALTDGLLVVRYNHDPASEAGKVNKVDSIAVKQSAAEAHQRQKEIGAVPAANASAAPGGVSVAAGDVNGDGGAASPKPKSGSIPYLNRTRQKELKDPAAAGSLTVTVRPGHGLCTAGKSLGTLTLAGSGGRTYTLTGVTVAGCGVASAGDRPTEQVSLNYTKIE